MLDSPVDAKAYLERLCGSAIKRRFNGCGKAEFESWKSGFSGWLRELFARNGLAPGNPEPPLSKVIAETRLGDLRRIDLRFYNPEFQTVVPATVLEPAKSIHNGAAILCQHGHGNFGRLSVVGDNSNPKITEEIHRYNYDYGLRLAESGYTVVAIDLMRFGERALPDTCARPDCDAVSLSLQLFGVNLLALNISDIRHALSLISSWPGVDAGRVGMCGLSYGGRLTMFTTALDERIKAAVSSGASNTYADRVQVNIGPCGCQNLPGLLPEADTPDIFASVAPRPLQVQYGLSDPLIVKAPAEEGFAHIERCYKEAGAPGGFNVDRFRGGHVFHLQPAFEWFNKWLA